MSKKETGDKPKKGKGLMLKLLAGVVLVGAGGGGAYALLASGLVGTAHATVDNRPHLVRKGGVGLVDPPPLGVVLIAGGAVEEDEIANERAADAHRRFRLRRQEGIAERARPKPHGFQIGRQLVTGHEVLRQPIQPGQTAEAVGAAPAHGIGHRAGGAPEFGGDAGARQVHLGDVEQP